MSCFHLALSHCAQCTLREPRKIAPPVPWEMPNLSFGTRLMETMLTALHPSRSAVSLIGEGVGPAVRFSLLTMVPLALLRGVIPYTHTLQFGDGFDINVIEHATTLDIALDVFRAAGLSLLLSLVSFLAIALPFVSLSRAYGIEQRPVALRMMLYRGFLLTLSMQSVFFWVISWALPSGFAQPVGNAVLFLELIPLVLLFVSMRVTARIGHGVGAFASLIVVLVPFGLLIASQLLVARAVDPLMPRQTAPVQQGAPQ